jgi:16S rRNA (guanine527-N7)-methyltransferase
MMERNPPPDTAAVLAALPESGPALWAALAGRARIVLSEQQSVSLAGYLDLLLAGNETMNLTRITDRSAAEVQHVADALTILPFLPGGPFELADVGSGGGVPGIPLAIVRPDARFLLIESTRKKAEFLRRTVATLGLSNVRVSEERAEDLAQLKAPNAREVREHFDVAVARAVATMVWLAEWCLPLVKKGGRMLAMKGPKVTDELPPAAKAIRLCGGGPPVLHAVALPFAQNHLIVEIAKTGRCDSRYPRPATLAKNRAIT